MRISIYKLPDGSMDVLVEASIGSGKPPILTQGVTEENVVTRVRPIIEAQKGRRISQPADPI